MKEITDRKEHKKLCLFKQDKKLIKKISYGFLILTIITCLNWCLKGYKIEKVDFFCCHRKVFSGQRFFQSYFNWDNGLVTVWIRSCKLSKVTSVEGLSDHRWCPAYIECTLSFERTIDYSQASLTWVLIRDHF